MLFENLGLQVTSLPLDPFAGIDLDLWERRLAQSRPGLVYAISAFQNPTGYSYASHELTGLLSLAERYRFALLEDDWGSDMLSGGEYRPMLRMLGGDHVLYVNSFTADLGDEGYAAIDGLLGRAATLGLVPPLAGPLR